ncbi:hypothetical protein L2E82_15099 [Cichorium intybus]|uniref:Uncharacterized protein n=1 Tax=Cichorium intybus TaxID=13427 RepID=A0ACB9F1W3_CICIN|nr:hypothetical protein L2E82_15099 [Cichorium intybus]
MEGDKANQHSYQAHKATTEQVRSVDGVVFKERDGRSFADVLEELEEGEYRPEVTIGKGSKGNSTSETQKTNGGNGYNDRNHHDPAPEIPANPVENQESGVERSFDVPIHEKGAGNINSSKKGAELNVISTIQPTNEINGSKEDKAGCNFGPIENLIPMGRFGPFPSNGGPISNSDRRAKKRRLDRYSPYSSPTNGGVECNAPLDLNFNPCPCPINSGEPVIEVGENPTTEFAREVEDTVAIGEKVGFQFEGRIDGIEKLIGGNGDTNVDQ